MISKLSFAALVLLISGQAHADLIQGSGFITASTGILPCDTSVCGDTLGIGQISDGISADGPWNGFAGATDALGTISLDLIGVFDLHSFTLWNDINVRAEGVNSFQLKFFDTSDDDIITSPEYFAPVSQADPQTYTFGSEILGVSKVDLIVLSLIDLPNSVRAGIEIREVAFNGTLSPSPNPVPVPAAFWLFGTALIGFIGVSRRTKVG